MSFLIKHSLFAILNTTVEAGGGRKGDSESPFAVNAEWDSHKEQMQSISKANESCFSSFFIRAEENDQIDLFQLPLNALAMKTHRIC